MAGPQTRLLRHSASVFSFSCSIYHLTYFFLSSIFDITKTEIYSWSYPSARDERDERDERVQGRLAIFLYFNVLPLPPILLAIQAPPRIRDNASLANLPRGSRVGNSAKQRTVQYRESHGALSRRGMRVTGLYSRRKTFKMSRTKFIAGTTPGESVIQSSWSLLRASGAGRSTTK